METPFGTELPNPIHGRRLWEILEIESLWTCGVDWALWSYECNKSPISMGGKLEVQPGGIQSQRTRFC